MVFLGSKPIGFTCFSYLLEQCEQLNVIVSGLLTQQRDEFDGSYDLATLAAAHNVPVLKDISDIPACDILYSVQYHNILTAADIAKAGQIAVNLHMAPLPEYRGCNQFSWAIIDEKEEFGTTIHIMDPGIDSGDILFQKRFPIPDNCWVDQLYKLTYEASLRLFQQTLAHIVNGNYTPLPQALLVPKFGTSIHYRHEINRLKQLDPTWDKTKIDRHIRATSMPGFEPPYFLEDGKKMYISPRSS